MSWCFCGKKFEICPIKTKILFVCLGNICRSPLAEGIFNEIIQKNKTGHLFETDSAGTSDFHCGELPDHRTLKNAKANGLILTHKCRQFTKNDFYEFDHIIAMDDSNLRDILKLKPAEDNRAKIIKMRFYDPSNKNANVPDPWFGGEKGFEEIYQILERCCQNFYKVLEGKES